MSGASMLCAGPPRLCEAWVLVVKGKSGPALQGGSGAHGRDGSDGGPKPAPQLRSRRSVRRGSRSSLGQSRLLRVICCRPHRDPPNPSPSGVPAWIFPS